MSKTAKVIVCIAATVAGMLWLFGVLYLAGEVVKPWIALMAAAYPWAALGLWWLLGTASSAALTCAMEDDGVTWGALSICATVGGLLAPVAIGAATLFGPAIASFALSDKWFPSQKKPPKDYPPGHWSKRIAFRCPGKPRKSPAPTSAANL